MRNAFTSAATLLGLACAILSPGSEAYPQGARGAHVSTYSSLGVDDLSMRLSFAGPVGYAGLGLEAKDEDLGFVGAVDLGSPEDGGARLIAGPGSASGLLRVLVDPTSPTALSRGELVEIDRSLESRSSVLSLGAGPLSFFALAGGRGIERQLETASAGIACELGGPGGGLALITAASRDGLVPASSGWRPDPLSAPASNPVDPLLPCYGAALVADRHGPSNAALFALAASYGRLAGPGLAMRLESREIVGLCDLRLVGAVAAPGFLDLAGPRQERLLDVQATARFAMRRASSLLAEIATEAKGGSLFYAPSWGRRGSLRLILPVDRGAVFETKIDAEEKPEGGGSESWEVDLAKAVEGDSMTSSVRLDSRLSWDSSFAGLGLGIETELTGGGGLPCLGLHLDLAMLEGGERESPALATGGLSLELPCGAGASVKIDLSLTDRGTILAPAAEGAPADTPLLRLRYRSSFSLPSPSERR
jgi:hypothetical protein